MDDMNAFERQVAGEVLRTSAPPRSVNAAVVFAAVTTQSPKWRFQSMFSATKFVVAGAVLALFGGFLLSGVLTQRPSDDRLPGVGASASATTQAEPTEVVTSEPEPNAKAVADTTTRSDILPGVDLVAEEVEPGVYRVMSDGVRDLSREIGAHPWYQGRESIERDDPGLGLGLDALRGDISVAPDGSVWYFGPDDFYRVGDASGPAAGEPGPTTNGSVSWAPDGTAWLHHDGDLSSFVDGSWSAHEVKPKGRWVGAVAVASDGPVWTLASVGPDELVRRLDIDGWTDFVPPRRFNVNAYGSGNEDEWLKAGVGGDVWLIVRHRGGRVLVQFDGSTWTLHEPPGIPSDTSLTLIDTAADGSLWAYYGGAYTEDRTGYIGRYKDGEWAVLGPGDGVPLAGGLLGGYVTRGLIEAASNGDVWLTLHQDDRGAGTNCDGIARFDGQSWTQFLAGECVYGLDTAADGTLWLLTGTPVRDDGSPGYSHTYVIAPEAVPGIE